MHTGLPGANKRQAISTPTIQELQETEKSEYLERTFTRRVKKKLKGYIQQTKLNQIFILTKERNLKIKDFKEYLQQAKTTSNFGFENERIL